MKATRREYIEDLKAIDDLLVKFLYKHGRIATQDLDVLYAVESVMENDGYDCHYEDRWEAMADLAAAGYQMSESVDDYRADLVYTEVAEAMENHGLAVWVE